MEDDFNDRRDAFVRLLEKYGAEVKEIAQVCARSFVFKEDACNENTALSDQIEAYLQCLRMFPQCTHKQKHYLEAVSPCFSKNSATIDTLI